MISRIKAMLMGLAKPTFEACVVSGLLMIDINNELRHSSPVSSVRFTDDLTSLSRRCGD
jgi:hypothetical protein